MNWNLSRARRSRSMASIALGPLSITAASGAQHKSGSRGTIHHCHLGSHDGLPIGRYRHKVVLKLKAGFVTNALATLYLFISTQINRHLFTYIHSMMFSMVNLMNLLVIIALTLPGHMKIDSPQLVHRRPNMNSLLRSLRVGNCAIYLQRGPRPTRANSAKSSMRLIRRATSSSRALLNRTY